MHKVSALKKEVKEGKWSKGSFTEREFCITPRCCWHVRDQMCEDVSWRQGITESKRPR